MTQTHTPGPWIADHMRNCYGVRVATTSGHAVADVVHHLSRGDETFANARLIAAAPDLLTSLHRLVYAALSGAPPPLLDVEQARAAITKAAQP